MKQFSSRMEPTLLRPVEPVHGFPRGSTILTLDGALPVEFLSPGDRIITRDSGMAVLRGVECIAPECETVAVMAGTLGADRPESDVILPAGAQVLLRDWRAQAMCDSDQAMAPLMRLVDGEFIRMAGRRRLPLIRLHFDAPHILYVDGMELGCDMPESLQHAA